MNKTKLICVLTCLVVAVPCAARTITVDDDWAQIHHSRGRGYISLHHMIGK